MQSVLACFVSGMTNDKSRQIMATDNPISIVLKELEKYRIAPIKPRLMTPPTAPNTANFTF
jgi:hypothetical protein